MATYHELLKHPKWQKRRLEVLELADFSCINCGSENKTLHVHHCYYVKGKKPWEYPDDALKCICEDCHKKTEDKKLKLSKLMGLVSDEDKIYGYVLGSFLYDNMEELINIENYEIAEGVADYWGLNLEEVLLPHLYKNDKQISGKALNKLVTQFGTPTKPLLERIAKRIA